jgi:hypothetical protein
MVLRPLLLSTLLFTAACGSSLPGLHPDGGSADGDLADAGNDAGLPLSQRYYVLALNATWTYRFTSGSTTYIRRVESFGDLGGEKAGISGFTVRDTFFASSQNDFVSGIELQSMAAIRHTQQHFVDGTETETQVDQPFLMLLDESKTNAGDALSQTYTAEDTMNPGQPNQTMTTSSVTHAYTVVASDESVTVPAGTFTGCLHISFGAGSDEWYARGVGRIKTSLYELLSYTIP